MNEHLAFAGFLILTLLYWLSAFAALSLSDYGYSRAKSAAMLLAGFVAAAVAGVFGWMYLSG